MRISDSRRVLFLHVPKTGGASVEVALDRKVPDIRAPYARHTTLTEVLRLEPQVADYWIFGFVRNPWARMVSWWAMIDNARIAAEEGNEAQIARFENYAEWKAVRGFDFDEFVTRGADEVERIAMPQLVFLTSGSRRPDFIGRSENIVEDFNVARARLGLRPKERMPHAHKGKHGHYRDYYTPATRQRVAELFAVDIDEFGYEF